MFYVMWSRARCGACSTMALAASSASLVPCRALTCCSKITSQKICVRNSSTGASTSASASSFAKSALFGRRLAVGVVGVGVAGQVMGFGKAFASTVTKEKSLHDFTVKDIDGKDKDLSEFKGKVLLVVNVASQCGLTNGNYKELNELYKRYKSQGFEILAFPCNQFGGQEPGTNSQIKEVACSRFKAEFPIFDKVDVNGSNTAPVYEFLKSSKGGLLGDNIKWNFGKFLVNKDGLVVERYAPTTSPLQIENDIKKLL